MESNVCGVLSLTFSIISIFIAPCFGAGLVLSIPAFILSIVGMKKPNSGTAVAGLVISIGSSAISIVVLLILYNMSKM